jgi:hypothetical protein
MPARKPVFVEIYVDETQDANVYLRSRGEKMLPEMMAVGVRFELTEPCGSLVFETSAINQLCQPTAMT